MKFPGFHEPIEGLELTQSKDIDNVFPLLKDIDLIIEIGTWKGGFPVFLKKIFNCEVHTFDIVEWVGERRQIFEKYGINYHIQDVFESNVIIYLCGDPRRKMLLCDGGKKADEFHFFVNHLNKGDIIGMHDFGVNQKYFNKHIRNIKWTTSLESSEDQVNGLIIDKVIKRHKHWQAFTDVVWGMYEKL